MVAELAWDFFTGVAKMAWDVMSVVTKTAWDVLSGVANLCGMFCPGCQKMAWDVLSGNVLFGSHLPLVLEVPGSIPARSEKKIGCPNMLSLVSFAGMTLDKCIIIQIL